MNPHRLRQQVPQDLPKGHDTKDPARTDREADAAASPQATFNQRSGTHLKAFPIHVPTRLVKAFQELGTEPVLSGGMAVQVWTGKKDGQFETSDLDFITHIVLRDLEKVGIKLEATGRHAVVDDVPVEFPSGPLAVGDLFLDPLSDSLLVPTESGEQIRCIRPEACVLDRLTLVAGSSFAPGFLQAAEVTIIQSQMPYWDDEWIDTSAKKAGLGKLWDHLKTELESRTPTGNGLKRALKIGWG